MKEYKIYADPEGDHIAIKQGWSWPAFIFGALWAMGKNMWLRAIGVIALAISFSVIIDEYFRYDEIDDLFIRLLCRLTMVAIYILFGIYGNRWIERKLLKKGYQYEGVMVANNPEKAVVVHINEKQGGGSNDSGLHNRGAISEPLSVMDKIEYS